MGEIRHMIIALRPSAWRQEFCAFLLAATQPRPYYYRAQHSVLGRSLLLVHSVLMDVFGEE